MNRGNELPSLCEEYNIFQKWNATDKDYPLDQCLHELIERQAARNPDQEVVFFEKERLSYAELNDRSNQCAHYLREIGIGPNTMVGVLMERSPDTVVAVLGILKSGGAYVPLDSGYPKERLCFMLEDALVSTVLTQERFEGVLEDFDGTTLSLDSQWSFLSGKSKADLENRSVPDDLAYVIYTSGSTGNPKGCMISHKAICNRLIWMQEHYQVTDKDRILHKTSAKCDVAMWELFLPLLSGACLIVAGPKGNQDNHYLAALIRKEHITICHFIPSMLRSFLNQADLSQCWFLRHIFVSGEALPLDVVKKCKNNISARLHNLYSVEEAAVDVAFWECEEREDKKVLAGRPIANTKIYILDAELNQMPVGAMGEVYIGGVGLAKGYVNQQGLTEERFITNPFSKETDSKLYRTGDQALYLPDGNIEISGCMDAKKKWRGGGIELGKIETSVSRHGGHGVKEASCRLTEEEKNKIIEAWNDTACGYNRNQCIHELFEEKAEEFPHNVATICVGQRLTYKEINERANQLSGYLRREGVGPETFVGICLDRSHETVIGLLGILKAGGAYVPLQTSDPQERLTNIIKTAAIKIVLTESGHSGVLEEIGLTKQICMDQEANRILKENKTNHPQQIVQSHNTAYVIFTSGSTGKPKGVVVQHRPVINLIEWAQKRFAFNESDVCLFINPLNFDLSVFDIFGMLAYGAAIHIVDDESRMKFSCLAKLLCQEEISFWNSAPAALQLLVPFIKAESKETNNEKLRLVFLSGDWVPVTLPGEIRSIFSNAQVIALGGATEATVWSNYYPTDDLDPHQKSVPYGRPIQNARYYILDQTLTPCPVGVEGDLYIGGECLSTGYMNAPEITAKSFIRDPFVEDDSAIMYKTGDLARFFPDGNIEFLGRADFQVKVRGYRIELEEIEHRLRQHDDIKEAVVLVKENEAKGQKIVAYIVVNPGKEVTTQVVRAFCKKALPNYMAPNLVMPLPHLPVTPNGKVDRKALPWPITKNPVQDKETLQPVEKSEPKKIDHKIITELLSYFTEILDAKDLTISDDLFDIGATSFTMVQVVEKIQDEYGITIPVEVFLNDPRVLTIGNYVDKALSQAGDQQNKPAPENGAKPIAGAPTNEGITTELLSYFAEILDAEGLTISDDLFDIGATSFTMVQVVEKIQEEHGVTIPVEVFLNDPRVLTIGNYVDKALSQAGDQQNKPAPENGAKPIAGAPTNEGITTELLSYFAEILDAEGLTISDDLFDIGATSFTMVQVVEKIQEEHGVTIPVEVFLNDPRVLTIGNYVDKALSQAGDQQNKPAPENGAKPIAGAPTNEGITTELLSYFIEILDVKGLTMSDDLFDVGATSFTMVKVVEKIQDEYGVTIPVEVVLDNPTVGAIADYMLKQFEGMTPVVPHDPEPQEEQQISEEVVVQLQPVTFREEAYTQSSAALEYTHQIVSFAGISRLLSLLQCRTIKGRPKYLYPSAGGMNPVQTYIYIKENRVEGVLEGIYYYQPEEHALYTIKAGCEFDPSIFSETDGVLFEQAGFALFLIAQMEAIEPTYQEASPVLSILDAGYMGQLMMSEQRECSIGLTPVVGVDFNKVGSLFKLDKTHRFIHCIAGGVPSENSPMPDHRSVMPYPPFKADQSFASFLNPEVSEFKTLTKEENDSHHAKKVHIRRFSQEETFLKLDPYDFSEGDHALRSCQRTYPKDPVSFEQFSKFLSLLKPENIEGVSCRLHASIIGVDYIQTYLYIKKNGVEGVAEGVYVYDSENHALVLVTPGPLAEIKSSYTPFNRKHYQQAKFCLFWVGDLKALDAVYQHDNLYIALLETGYRGQLLIEKKAEFDIGLCPIGGMRFEKIRTAFNVEDSQELIQSFMGGRTESPIPIGRDALEVGRGELGQVEKRSNQVLYRDLAIVGISGRYASAEKIETYWENLKEGKSNLKEWPKNRPGGIEDVGIRGGFLNDVDCFDSLLFAISPAEAKGMDPQERLFLEVVWECLENAGYTGAGLNGCSQRVGVFVGAMWSDYQNQGSDAWSRTQIPDAASFHSSIANRVSYFFNFNGPSASLDTSCSSALTALHVACESIQNGDCDVAVVGGVNIINHPYHQALLRYLDLLSKNNECHPFGAEANGWVVGEGVGAVLIKTKEQAEKAGDTIHGLIKATAISHSGKTMRYGAPNAQSQKESILRVLDKADLSPESIGYVEAAAPGASIADASEMTAIQEVFRDVPSLPVGTVKSNIGHLESASAMSQLTKVLLQVKHGELAPTLNCTPINPMFKLEENGVELVEALKPWDHPRRALINAFGATGSGGHIILEEYVQKRAVKPSRPTLIVLSAATDEQLRRLVGRLQDFMAHSSLPCLSDIGYTLRVGRVEMDERLAVVVETHDELRERLAAYLNGGEKKSGLFRGSVIGETPSPERKEEPTVYTMAEQWVRGVPFDSKRIDQGYERRVPLPTYPFAKEKHWVEMYETVSPTNLNNGKDLQEEHGANGLEKIETKLKEMFAEVSEIPVARIGAKTRLEQYGLNSLMINKLNLRLEKDFGELPKTLFFEYSTLHELAKYFLESHAEQVQELSAIAPKVNVSYTAKEKNKTSYRSVEDDWNDQVAIVGISGRYPKAPNLEVYWENLKNGIDCISEIPPERWDHLKYYHTEKQTPGKAYSKWGGFIDDVDKFDPLFFGISPREAELLDPEERIFLETAWHTCEDAGYTRSSLDSVFNGKVGVFVGVMYGDYQLLEGRHPNGPFSRLVSAAYGSIANRVSYVLDVHGPSMAIDTMCSSSLTALHLASESIRRGECEAAIAGGINLSIHPRKYVQQSQLGMSSTDGRCRSFGEGGDGFVPGEGVGAVLLKPLTKAIKDGDHIYGLIKGIAINHDGKTNGYTVPNPHAQTTMILDALKRAQVDPRTISYLEAHGTGTSLGDPVEIRGLSKAFGTYTEQRQFCPIGSVKSNLGHLEAAAGMVGLTKVLFQMKHQRIVPSLYSKELNPNINFEKSPFYVQQELAEWKRPIVEIDGEHKEYPRIACISSFGAGGSNAHVIIEEYLDDGSRFKVQSSGLETKGPYIIVLSAKNAGRLKEGAKNLQTFLTSNSEPQTLNLHEVAYTLQVGREAMEERLGLVVDSKKELEEQLQAFMEGKEDVEDMYLGRVKRNQDGLVVYAADDDMAKMVEAWAAKGKYNKLLDLWVKGLNVDWNKLYGENKPQRISLPTYPFARERYWIEGNADCGLGIAETGKELHPLVHENTSDVSELRFSSTFTGKEFFFADHPVKGEKILPGTAYLEMVREAVEQACGKLVKDHQSIIHLNNVVWARPISVGTNPQEVHIGLFPEENGEIAYEIYTAYPGEGKSAIRNPQSAIDSVVHSQGVALFASAGQRLQLDLKALQETCAQRVLSTDECYTTFQAMGIEYSPSYQSIEQLYIGENDVLAKLALPSSVTETKDQFTLNPILLDSALQASIGLVFPNRAPSTKNLEPLCPVALERLEIMDSCKESMWVRVRHSEGSSASGQVWKLDIDLCDTSGNVCVKMHGLSCRTLQQDQEYAHAPSSPQLQLTDTQQVPLPVLTNKSSKVVLSPLSEAQPFSIQIKQVRQPEKTLLTEPVSITSTLENQSELTAPVASKISKEVLGKELVVSFAQALYMKQSDIDIDKQFVEMGLDSIVGVEWIQTINKTYSLHIPATKVYDYPSIRELARYMKRELEKQEKGTPLQKAIEQMPERVIAEQKPSKIYPLPMTAPVASKISKEVLGKELVASFAQALYMKQSDIDINKQFVEMGLDSIVGVEWIQTINKTYSLHISATKVYDYPSIRELAGYVQKELEKQEGASSQKAIEQMPERVIAEQKPSKIYPLPMTAPVASKISKEVLGKELVVSFAQALYMKQSDIDIDKQFVEMGLDSIVGVEWIQTINKTYSLHIPATKVYDYPSIRELAGYVQKELEKQERAPLQKTSEHMPERSIAPQKPSKVYALPTLRKQHSIRPLGGPKQAYTHQTQEVNPGHLGSLVFQKRYGCKLSYFTGSMYRGIASEQLVLTMGKENLLSFFGSAGFTAKELEPRIASIQSQLGLNKPYGICLIASLNHPEEEMQQAKLFVQYNIPIIEAAAFSALTPALVYCRVKGLCQTNGRMVFSRRIIAKCSRLEVARLFLAPPPIEMVNDLVGSGLITKEEADLSQRIPMVDDLAVEADSGGHTDQGVSFSLLPSMMALKDSLIREYHYQEEILIGCGGGIGTPESVASAFALGADFIFTGSINQCTVESGAHDIVKDLLSTLSVHDTTTAPAGDMFEMGAKVQVVKKKTQFPNRANRLYQLFQHYKSVEEIPVSIQQDIEKHYFKKTFSEVWDLVCAYKNKKSPEQISEALENARIKLKLIFQWYFARTNQVTFHGDELESDNFQIHSGPAMGAFNQWVKGTSLENWRNRHVDHISEQLMSKACEYIQRKPLFISKSSPQESVSNQEPVSKEVEVSSKAENLSAPKQQRSPQKSDIAIIGMSGQFPRAKNVDEFWENLSQGKDGISEIPATRWSIDQLYDPDKEAPGKTYCKWMGVLEDADQFDPLFFNISPAEAERMDPQQRLFLENAWHCIEDAGLNPASLSGSSCGVFAGCAISDYGQSMNGNALNAQGLMGESPSILTARIAYLLNLKGPCLAIDTACSSSLVAIAEACNSLQLKTSDLALAGGVCVLPGPSMHIMTSKAGMLSEEGRCFTFDKRANGFVPGEGVGIILLKRLSDAIGDGDQIHGVIKGWGVNQDGKTNGITAPSVNSQIALEKEVYDRFGINPEKISLVEAHGTGTKLGDPIEVEALIESFRSYTDKEDYCALGSVKSNIGHLLPAAGVTGAIKLLLALKHRKLPPTIHYNALNEHINLEKSPFYVNTERKEWRRAEGQKRCSAISSFGFSGTNAHVVIEEYLDEKSEILNSKSENKECLIVLSARDEERLQEYVEKFYGYLTSNIEEQRLNIESLAYTLQVGREAMEERLAFIVNSLEELTSRLSSYLEGKKGDFLRGNVKKEKVDIFLEGKAGRAYIETAIGDKESKSLAQLWVKGVEIDWGLLYPDQKPKKVSLPTYPFKKESYWIRGNESAVKPVKTGFTLHPLMHENTSDVSELRFSSTFTGDEFFLTDHVVKGEKLLPGVAYLEMARAAVEEVAGSTQKDQAGIQLKHIVWVQPMAVNGHAQEVHIGLFPEENGQIQYEIYTDPSSVAPSAIEDKDPAEEEPIIHSQGVATLSSADEIPPLDLEALQESCKKKHLTSEACYEIFKGLGFDYGQSHQGLEEIYVGAGQVLAKLSLPFCVVDTEGQFVLHPSLLDSALQASIGLDLPDLEPGTQELFVPFGLERLEIMNGCQANMWAWVRYAKGSRPSDTVRKLDIDLSDQQGKVSVKIRGFSSRALEGEVSKKPQAIGTLMIEPVWREKAVDSNQSIREYADHQVFLCGLTQTIESVGHRSSERTFIELKSDQKRLEKRFEEVAFELFKHIKKIMKAKPQGQALLQILVPAEGIEHSFSAFSGLLKTAHLENPRIMGQVIAVDPEDVASEIIAKLEENARCPEDSKISYSGKKRLSQVFEELPIAHAEKEIPWKEGGVYLITGGAGGLGLIFAKEIASKAKNVTLILTGHSVLNREKQDELKKIESLGSRIEYRQIDVTGKQAVEGLMESLQKDFGGLDGILHSAGVIRDNFILKKTKEESQEILGPKVSGLVNIDQASKDMCLDFFVLFSSGSGALGNPGQADYATANAFMNAYATYRNERVASKERQGQTLSINWPLWREGGMQIDEATETMMMQSMGMVAMQTLTGLQFFYHALASGKSQVMIMEGQLARMRQKLFSVPLPALPKPDKPSDGVDSSTVIDMSDLLSKVQGAIMQAVSKLLKVKLEDLDAEAELNEYGFDSITLTDFSNKLNQQYNLELNPTVFFEHPTIADFASYLIEEHRAVFAAQFSVHTQVETLEPSRKEEVQKDQSAKRIRPRFTRRMTTPPQSQPVESSEPVAIVGMSGCFPMARDLNEFWENLKAGKDCINEIPQSRWDWEKVYGDPQKEVNKTNIKWGGFIDGVGKFDPLFFGISPREAELMDPQQRLLMTYVWLALEDAGYSASSLSGSNAGIFVGTGSSGYSSLIADRPIEGYTSTGIVPSVGPNRMSYF